MANPGDYAVRYTSGEVYGYYADAAEASREAATLAKAAEDHRAEIWHVLADGSVERLSVLEADAPFDEV
jgi:hypothetical protein